MLTIIIVVKLLFNPIGIIRVFGFDVLNKSSALMLTIIVLFLFVYDSPKFNRKAFLPFYNYNIQVCHLQCTKSQSIFYLKK